jgi:AmmeMemoRadiSam system protein A
MSPPLEDGSLEPIQNSLQRSGQSVEFSPEERRILLRLAHDSITAAVENRQLSLTAPSAHLADPRGVFTTLYCRRALRGCVGYVVPTISLYGAVAETARAAAFEDIRFPPLTPEEVPELAVSLSVLSPLQDISPEQVEVGRHGLLIKFGNRRGLLLPQVPVENAWDRIAFLEQTCRKAGLPTNAWQTGASIEAFTAEVFGDSELSP